MDNDDNTLHRKYKFLAYITVRDSVAFYLGIPKFLDEDNIKKVLHQATTEKVKQVKQQNGGNLTQQDYNKCLQAAKRSVSLRIKELQEDYERCEDVLFKDNLWLQILGLNESFFKRYFEKLDQSTKDKLSVVPKFKTRDHSLGRPYINDNFLGSSEF